MGKIKAYIKPFENNSRSLSRVTAALTKHKEIEVVESVQQCDIIILHVIGRQDATIRRIKTFRKPYAIIQYSIRRTKRPSVDSWLPIWAGAKVVWSYLDLKKYCNEDTVQTDFNFYHAPLGSDSNVFYQTVTDRDYIIGCSSNSYLTESAKEIILAANKNKVFFLGNELNKQSTICRTDLSDSVLAHMWSKCRYVSGLRRTEGFELPALEGLLCGARPIFFDRDHYKNWFEDWGIFIPEGSRPEVIDSLRQVFEGEHKPVTQEEIFNVKKRFDWQPIVDGFWEQCLA